jgi:Flp pilus assembly secretin CpaC
MRQIPLLIAVLNLITLLLWLPTANAEEVALPLHGGTLIATPLSVKSITIGDPRIVSATALSKGRYHLHGIGLGETDVLASLSDGSQVNYTVTVKKKALKGKTDRVVALGRSIVLELTKNAEYVGSGDPNVLHVSHFEGSRRYHMVGVGLGKTELMVLPQQGEAQRIVVRVDEEMQAEGRTEVPLKVGANSTLPLAGRPSNVTVANGQVTSVQIIEAGDGSFSLRFTGMRAGITDVLASTGLGSPPVWFTIIVSANRP